MNKNDIIKRQISILFLILLAITIVPIAISGITYPTLTGYITDNANIITPEYRQKITELAENINKNTTVEIAVLTVQSLEGDSPENYALKVFRENGVGKKDNNNGLLILVAKDDRKYKFEVGYGLEGTIPDAMKVPIGDKIITPNFRNGDYGKGIYESMIVIEGLVTNNTEVLSKYGLNDQPTDIPIWVIILIVIIILILIVVVIAATDGGSGGNSGGGGWGGGGGGSGGGDSGFGGFGGGSSGGGGFGGGW